MKYHADVAERLTDASPTALLILLPPAMFMGLR